MPRRLISDAHEWINEIPTVPIYRLANPQPRARAWTDRRGKKTLLSLTLVWRAGSRGGRSVGGRRAGPAVRLTTGLRGNHPVPVAVETPPPPPSPRSPGEAGNGRPLAAFSSAVAGGVERSKGKCGPARHKSVARPGRGALPVRLLYGRSARCARARLRERAGRGSPRLCAPSWLVCVRGRGRSLLGNARLGGVLLRPGPRRRTARTTPTRAGKQRQAGSLTGAVHPSKGNAGVPRSAPEGRKPSAEQKGKSRPAPGRRRRSGPRERGLAILSGPGVWGERCRKSYHRDNWLVAAKRS